MNNHVKEKRDSTDGSVALDFTEGCFKNEGERKAFCEGLEAGKKVARRDMRERGSELIKALFIWSFIALVGMYALVQLYIIYIGGDL